MSWRSEAVELAKTGRSWRQVARELGVAKSTVSDYLRKMVKGGSDRGYSGAKILFLDIETSPIFAAVWSLWQQGGIGLSQIKTDWHILSFCAKWGHSEDVIYKDQRNAKNIEDDFLLLKELWKLLDEADIVVAHNGRRFDVKKINARFILNDFTKPSSYRVIDTLEIAKQQFAFTSNKLEYLTDNLCSEHKKLKHSKFPGYELWKECLKGNPEAWEEMEEYNITDVLSLEELYHILSGWDNKLPNLDVYYDGEVDMSFWEEDGFVYTNLGKYQRYRNSITGVQRRGRENLLSKEKRKQLLANIV